MTKKPRTAQILFRAWKKPQGDVAGRYATEDELYWLLLRHDGTLWEENHKGLIDVTNEYEIELWIGWQDKTGRNIYAGDELDGGYDDLCGGVVFWNKETLSFSERNYHAQSLSLVDTSGRTVTGNIHDEKED